MDLTFGRRYLNRFSEYQTTTLKERYSVCKTNERSAVIVSECEGATLLKNITVLISIHDMT